MKRSFRQSIIFQNEHEAFYRIVKGRGVHIFRNSYRVLCTTEPDDLRLVCGDDDAEAEEETIGDLDVIP